MKTKLLRVFAILTLVLVPLLALATPVLAIANPTTQTIRGTYAFRDLLEDGDQLYLMDEYTVEAGGTTETAGQALLFRLKLGAVELGSAAPYSAAPNPNSGWDRNLVVIYFTSAEAPAWNPGGGYVTQLVGNPTLTWPGDPPSVVGVVDWWSPLTGASANRSLLSSKVLYLAQELETAWAGGIDLIAVTASGNKLTATGEAIFMNIIPNARTVAPDAFSGAMALPEFYNKQYGTGGTVTNLGGTATGSPISLAKGATTIVVTVVGTFTVALPDGTSGVATSGTATVTGSPVDLPAGASTVVTVAGAIGNFIVTTSPEYSKSLAESVIGTPLDFTGLATALGISRMWTSTILWFIAVGALLFFVIRGTRSTKPAILMTMPCVIGGGLLGMIPLTLTIGAGVLSLFLISFSLFYKPSSA